MSELDRQVEDLIATAQLDDAAADEIRAAMAEVKARKDAKLRGDVQRTVGETHLTIRESMNRMVSQMVGFSEDFQAWRADQEATADQQSRLVLGLQSSLVKREAADAGHIGALQEVTAGVKQLQQDFQSGINALGEHVDQLGVVQKEHTEQIGWLANMARTQEGRITDVIVQVDRHEVRLAEGELDRLNLTKRVQALESTIEQLRAHLGELTAHA